MFDRCRCIECVVVMFEFAVEFIAQRFYKSLSSKRIQLTSSYLERGFGLLGDAVEYSSDALFVRMIRSVWARLNDENSEVKRPRRSNRLTWHWSSGGEIDFDLFIQDTIIDDFLAFLLFHMLEDKRPLSRVRRVSSDRCYSKEFRFLLFFIQRI